MIGWGLAAAVAAAGCGARPPSGPAPQAEIGYVTDFLTLETEATLTVVVRGSRPLAYTALEQDAPPGVLLQFPGTGLADLAAVYHPPENDVVAAIRSARSEGGAGGARITIELKRKLGYVVEPAGNDLHLVFEKPGPARVAPPAAGRAKPAGPRPPARAGAAIAVTDLIVAAGPEGAAIRVATDGPVSDFVAFTLEGPARCVVDLNGVGGPAGGLRRKAVDSAFVKEVRYFAHPDKVRVVVETTPALLGSCAATGAENGLVVTVGRPPQAGRQTGAAPAP